MDHFFLFISLEDYRVLSDECFPSVRPSSPCSRELSFGVLCLLCCAKTKAGVSVQRESGPVHAFVCGAEIGIALQRQSACRFLKQTEVFFFSINFFNYLKKFSFFFPGWFLLRKSSTALIISLLQFVRILSSFSTQSGTNLERRRRGSWFWYSRLSSACFIAQEFALWR